MDNKQSCQALNQTLSSTTGGRDPSTARDPAPSPVIAVGGARLSHPLLFSSPTDSRLRCNPTRNPKSIVENQCNFFSYISLSCTFFFTWRRVVFCGTVAVLPVGGDASRRRQRPVHARGRVGHQGLAPEDVEVQLPRPCHLLLRELDSPISKRRSMYNTCISVAGWTCVRVLSIWGLAVLRLSFDMTHHWPQASLAFRDRAV